MLKRVKVVRITSQKPKIVLIDLRSNLEFLILRLRSECLAQDQRKHNALQTQSLLFQDER